eukprot:jgi/Hompol1/3320/HPOL_006466-RA
MSENLGFQDLRTTVIPAILGRIDLSKHVPSSRDIIYRWGPLIGKFTHSVSDQFEVISIVSTYAIANAAFQKAFAFTLRLLYDIDVVTEDVVLECRRRG